MAVENTTLIIKSQKGASITLKADSFGFVTAAVNGKEYHGTHAEIGVMKLGSRQGDYVQLAEGIAAIIAVDDLRAATAFFAKARDLADKAARERAIAQHKIDMRDPAYAAMIAHDRLVEDMNRRYSDN